MKTAVTVTQIVTRVAGITLLILGLLFWAGYARQLIPLHQAIGVALVLALLTLAGIGLAAKARGGLVALVVVWAVVMPVFGMMQTRLLLGSAHWVIQVLHLAVGIAALRFAEMLGLAIRRASPAAV